MKSYFTIFFTLVMPISILFTVIASIYFSMNYDFSKAFKLGILYGVMLGVAFSLLMALFILISRIIHNYRRHTTSPTPYIATPVTLNPALYENKHQSPQLNLTQKGVPILDVIEEKIMLLMDKSMAFEISLNSIEKTNIGNIIQQNKTEGFILLRSNIEEIKIQISTLTRHTAQVQFSSSLDNSNIGDLIGTLKAKEYSFLQY